MVLVGNSVRTLGWSSIASPLLQPHGLNWRNDNIAFEKVSKTHGANVASV